MSGWQVAPQMALLWGLSCLIFGSIKYSWYFDLGQYGRQKSIAFVLFFFFLSLSFHFLGVYWLRILAPISLLENLCVFHTGLWKVFLY